MEPGSPQRLWGPSPLNWLQPAAATERAAGGGRALVGEGRGRAGRPGGEGGRKVLPNTVGLLRLLLNGSDPGGGGGGGSDIPGERSRRRRLLLLHSLLASFPARSPSVASLQPPPPPSPIHTPRNLKPYGSRCRVTHPPSLPATSGDPVPPPFPCSGCRAGLSNGGHSGSLALTELSPSLPNFTSASLPARTAGTHARARSHTPGRGRSAAQPRRGARAPAPPSPQSPAPAALTSRRLPLCAPG